MLDEVSEDSVIEEEEDDTAPIAPPTVRRILTKQTKVREPDFLRVAQDSNSSSKSFDSYLNQEKKLSRQLSDPLKSVKKTGVISGTLSPVISRQSSKCRPLVVSSSTLCSSSPSHVDSGSETEASHTETESDEQSTIVNTNTHNTPVLSTTSSTTLNLVSLELKGSWSNSNSISDEDSNQSRSDTSLTDISFFVSLDHLPSSVYESVMTSFDVESASKASSPTFLTASLSSTITSPQCSFHSCSSSPPSSPATEASSKPQWRKMVKSDSVHEETVITINKFRENDEEASSTGCRRALSCPSAKSRRRSRQNFINQKHPEAGIFKFAFMDKFLQLYRFVM